MKEKLSYLWNLLQRVSLFIGNIISTVFMVVFYFSIFALFALPARFFTAYLKQKAADSNWVVKKKTDYSLEDLKYE